MINDRFISDLFFPFHFLLKCKWHTLLYLFQGYKEHLLAFPLLVLESSTHSQPESFTVNPYLHFARCFQIVGMFCSSYVWPLWNRRMLLLCSLVETVIFAFPWWHMFGRELSLLVVSEFWAVSRSKHNRISKITALRAQYLFPEELNPSKSRDSKYSISYCFFFLKQKSFTVNFGLLTTIEFWE